MGCQNFAPDTADWKVLFTPVKLEGFSQLELERYGGVDYCGSAFDSPAPNEFGDAAVVAGKACRLDFFKQFQCAAPIPFRAVCIGFQCFDKLRGVRCNLGVVTLTPIFRLYTFRRL